MSVRPSRRGGLATVALVVLWPLAVAAQDDSTPLFDDGALFDDTTPGVEGATDGAVMGDAVVADEPPPPAPSRRPAGQAVASASGAELRGLDKVTGQTTDLTVRDGQTVPFGRLSVTVTDCRYPVDDQSSNAYAHVVIGEAEGKPPIFDAWMVATSPALSALDHPRYDVWVMRCISS